MRNFIPIPALLCLLLSCSKKELHPTSKATAHCTIQSLYSTWYLDNDNYSYYKGPDSLSLNLYGDRNLRGKVITTSNLIAVVETATNDTPFCAILNPQQQITRARHSINGNDVGWADFTYNSTGQVTRITRDSTWNEDILLNYDSLGNVIRIQQKFYPQHYITFTYDYSTPIAGGDYDYDIYYDVMCDLKICQVLNLIDIRPHHKLLHAYSTMFPEFDNTYNNQLIDSQGKLVYYKLRDYAFTTNWFCTL